MSPARAKELLPIITAFAEGKEIEVAFNRIGSVWETYKGDEADEADFANPAWKWRIKPEPREWWLVLGTLQTRAFETKPTDCDAIHVREVLE